MDEVFSRLGGLTADFPRSLIHVVDILLVTVINYYLLRLIQGTRAWRIVGGILVFALALVLSDVLQLRTLHWLLMQATVLAPVALVLLLLPELRQALEGFAKLGFWPTRLTALEPSIQGAALEELVAALTELSEQRAGALVVVERLTQLDDIVANGVKVQAPVSAPLLGAIFYQGNPLHDGAVIIRGDVILAAACRLPLSENPELPAHIHMRHRAGIGISEQSDAVVLIVSEERGTISGAIDGKLTPLRTVQHLREYLNRELRGMSAHETPDRRWRFKKEAPKPKEDKA